jgi:hypothetical protein
MPHPNQPAVVRHPEVAGMMVALDPGTDYDAKDALVTTYPQFFVPVENAHEIVESVKIERATAEPGQRRTRTKPSK